MKLRTLKPHQKALIESADAKLRYIVADLREAGATKAANAVARARKSVQGAERHAARILSQAPQ